jgi:hypothetical protein
MLTSTSATTAGRHVYVLSALPSPCITPTILRTFPLPYTCDHGRRNHHRWWSCRNSRGISTSPEKAIALNLTGHPHVVVPADAAMLYGSELDYNYRTTPQTHLDGKPKVNIGFKGLGGGSVINNGLDGNARAVTTWLIKPRWMDKRRRQRLR